VQSAGQKAPGDVTTLQVYSRETVVDVTVTDDKGLPVHGLKESDFTVSEDGKAQSIRGFKEFGDGSLNRTLPKLPPNVYSNLGATPASGPVNVILLDVFHNDQLKMELVK